MVLKTSFIMSVIVYSESEWNTFRVTIQFYEMAKKAYLIKDIIRGIIRLMKTKFTSS